MRKNKSLKIQMHKSKKAFVFELAMVLVTLIVLITLVIQINKKLSKGDWEITVTKVGYYNPTVQYGEEKEYLRVDMIVKSIAHQREYFSPSGMIILDNSNNQYEKEYGGSLETYSEIYPGVTKEGYILFKAPPRTVKSANLIFEAGHDQNYRGIDYQYEFTLNS